MKIISSSLLILFLVVTGCSTEQLNESAYGALLYKECMDTHGYSDCDNNQPEFGEYKKQRDEPLNK